QALETRICQLLPVLMLARVDGKSPVEYLSASEGDIVRQMALQYIGHPTTSIQALLQGINHFLRNSKA
nr:hypothetical protein [Gammaproteobacteria bacterium]